MFLNSSRFFFMGMNAHCDEGGGRILLGVNRRGGRRGGMMLPITFLCVEVWISSGLAYTGCPRRNVPDFWRVFLMLKYTDITQNTSIQSWTATEIMAREKWGASCGSKYCNLHSWCVTRERWWPWEWNVVLIVPAWRLVACTGVGSAM